MMENNRGWVALHRDLANSPLWLEEPFTKGQAWADLIMLANSKVGYIRKRGITIKVKRGQVGYSEETLGKRWQWSRGKVRRFLQGLEVEQRIKRISVQQNPNISRLISIINYDKYQHGSTTNGTGTTNDFKIQKNKKNILVVRHDDEKVSLDEGVKEVLNLLNEERVRMLKQKGVRPITQRKEIEARLSEGASVFECCRVILTKAEDPFFQENTKYFHPTTLFRKSNYDKYVDESEIKRHG